MKQLVTLKVNGEEHELAISPDATLLNVLRDELGLLGTKQCGYCSCRIIMAARQLLDDNPNPDEDQMPTTKLPGAKAIRSMSVCRACCTQNCCAAPMPMRGLSASIPAKRKNCRE